MNKIWKYAIPIEDEFDLPLPAGSVPRFFGIQNNMPHLWVEVTDAEPVDYHFRLAGTGHDIDAESLNYIGSTQHRFDGALELVWHLYLMNSQELNRN